MICNLFASIFQFKFFENPLSIVLSDTFTLIYFQIYFNTIEMNVDEQERETFLVHTYNEALTTLGTLEIK